MNAHHDKGFLKSRTHNTGKHKTANWKSINAEYFKTVTEMLELTHNTIIKYNNKH